MDKRKKEILILSILACSLLIILPRTIFSSKTGHRISGGEGAAVPTGPMPGPAPAVAVEQNIDYKVEKAEFSFNNKAQLAAPEPASIDKEKIEYQGVKFRDPFEVPEIIKAKQVIPEEWPQEQAPPDDLPGITLLGIIWGSINPKAFIDNKIYGVGDVVGDAQILAINKKGVYFLYHDKKVLMKMKRQI